MGFEARKVLNSASVEDFRVPAVGRPQVRHFGLFELDLRAGELRRNGSKIKLQEQPFRILELLLQNPGEVVSRDEIRSRLWPEDTFVDFDHSLNAAIRRLRDALGDSAENPRFVETVARRGYRFVAPVNNGNQAVAEPASDTEAEKPALRTSGYTHFWWLISGVTAAILLLAAGIVLFLLRRDHSSQARISQLTANPVEDRVRAAVISPDGKYLAFADEIGFYLRAIDNGETHPISVPKGFVVDDASWFPNGAHMAVTLNKPGENSSLWDLSVFGGSARPISDEGFAPAVSPDGTHIAFLKGSKMRQQLWMVAADGSGPQKLRGVEGDYFGQIAWSPDGQKIAYARGTLKYGFGIQLAIEITELASQSTHELMAPAGLNLPLAWGADGRLIYMVNEPPPRQAEMSLWWIPVNRAGEIAGPATRMSTDPGAVAGISVSTDGKHLVMLKGVSQSDVYVTKLENGGIRISPPQRLTLDDRYDLPFDWSPDGREIVFASDRGGRFSIYKQAIDQTVAELLVGGSNALTLGRLSPDGTQLLYLSYSPEYSNSPEVSLMRMPQAGGPPQRVLKATSISNQQCARLPSTVCVYSEVSDNGLAFFNFDPLKGKGQQIFQIKDIVTKIYNWSLSPDGTTLAIARGRASDGVVKIRLVSVSAGTERWLTLPDLSDLSTLDWSADSESLWTASAGEEGNALLNVNLNGQVREVWRPQRLTVGWAIPSRDGRYLALQVSSGSANAWMLENF